MKNIFLAYFLIGILMGKAAAEPTFQLHSPSAISIDGSAMKALKIASDEFFKVK